MFFSSYNFWLEYLMKEKIFTIETLKYIFWQNLTRMYQTYIRKNMKYRKEK